jgi:hypothetical protein
MQIKKGYVTFNVDDNLVAELATKGVDIAAEIENDFIGDEFNDFEGVPVDIELHIKRRV